MFEKYALKWIPLWLSIGWLLIVSVIVLSLVRLGPATPGGQTDKVAHFLAYGTLMAVFEAKAVAELVQHGEPVVIARDR